MLWHRKTLVFMFSLKFETEWWLVTVYFGMESSASLTLNVKGSIIKVGIDFSGNFIVRWLKGTSEFSLVLGIAMSFILMWFKVNYSFPKFPAAHSTLKSKKSLRRSPTISCHRCCCCCCLLLLLLSLLLVKAAVVKLKSPVCSWKEEGYSHWN